MYVTRKIYDTLIVYSQINNMYYMNGKMRGIEYESNRPCRMVKS